MGGGWGGDGRGGLMFDVSMKESIGEEIVRREEKEKRKVGWGKKVWARKRFYVAGGDLR